MPHTPRKAPPIVEPLERRRLLADSAWVYPAADGDALIYQPTPLGDRIVDFSRVGYRDNLAPIPRVPVRVVVHPGKGNDRGRIQSAINRVSSMPLDPQTGFRGAVLLAPGTFQLRGSLKIQTGGIVLRGSGDGPMGSRLLATWRGQSPLIDVNFDGRHDRPRRGAARSITDRYVPAGARSFQIDDTAGLSVGDRIIVSRPSTAPWLDALGMHLLEFPWLPGTKDIESERTITRIEGRTITLDDPLTHSLDRRYGGGAVFSGGLVRRIHDVGIEDIRGDSTFLSRSDIDHAWWFVQFHATENAWVRRVTAQHFVQGLFTAEFGSRSITVANAVSRSPVSPIIGNMRYAFNLEPGAEKILVRDVLSIHGRHDFVTDGGGVHGPSVFVDAVARNSHADTGPHMHYATGILFDNVATDDQLNVRNRGDKGTNHGWAGANNVVWNSIARAGFRVRNPPGAQNWLIGGIGDVDDQWSPPSRHPLPNAPGFYDSVGRIITPRSLYYAQLNARKAHPDAQDREYHAGDIDGYTRDGDADDVYVDPDWRTAVKKRAGKPLGSFDRTKPLNRWVPFSFRFPLAPGERIVSASLSLGLRRTAGNTRKDRLYIDSLSNGRTFKSLGWRGLTGDPEARVIDLTTSLHHLHDGLLNIAIEDNIALDWAILHVSVEPPLEAMRAADAHRATPVFNADSPIRPAPPPILDERTDSIYD